MGETVKTYFDIDPQLFGENQVWGELKTVNIAHLNGIQLPSEYTGKKRRLIEKLYETYQVMGDPDQLTIDFPLTVCAIPNLRITDPMFIPSIVELIPSMDYYLAILDGHHRVRYGPQYGVHDFKSSIYSVSQALYNMKKQGKIDRQVTPEQYHSLLVHGMCDTIDAFGRRRYSHNMIPVKL